MNYKHVLLASFLFALTTAHVKGVGSECGTNEAVSEVASEDEPEVRIRPNQKNPSMRICFVNPQDNGVLYVTLTYVPREKRQPLPSATQDPVLPSPMQLTQVLRALRPKNAPCVPATSAAQKAFKYTRNFPFPQAGQLYNVTIYLVL